MQDAEALFWDCAAELFHMDEDAHEGTIFGFRCLRVREEFSSMPANDQLWVKLPEERVNELIEADVGEVCAPAGRPFREWVAISDLDEGLWLTLMHESADFVRPKR